MHLQYTPYMIPLLTVAAISAGVAIYVWPRRAASGGSALTLLALALMVWSAGYALEIASTDLPTKLFWAKAQYPGIVTAPLFWLVLAVNHFCPYQRLTYRHIAMLAIIPLITLALAFTTETHGLVWQHMGIEQVGGISVLVVEHGPWFWVHLVYSYLLLLVGAAAILNSISRMRELYRSQAVALIISVLAPWLGNLLYFLGANPLAPLDLTPFAFTITVLGLTWSIFGFRLVNIAPIARDIVVESMADGLIVVDTHGYIADVNPTAQRMLGMPAAQAIGKRNTEVFGDWQHLIDRYKDVEETLDQISVGEGEVQRWYQLHLTSLYDRRKQLLGKIVTIRDITEHKQIEEALAQERNLLRTIIDNIPDQIFARDTASRFIMSNKSDALAMKIDDPDLLIGKTDYDFYPPELAAMYQAGNRAVMESGQPVINQEEPSYTDQGDLRWVLTTKVPLHDRQGQVIGLVGIARDITARKIAEEQVRQLSRAVEASPVSIVITDTTGTIQYVNPKFTRMTGYTLDEAIGQNPRILKTGHTPLEAYKNLWETIKAGREWHGEFYNRKKNGDTFWELASISPITDAAGNITHFVAVKEDITERKHMQNELAQAHQQALEASRYKTELLAKVSHELRTPLGVILGFTEFLHKEMFAPLTAQQKHFTAEVLNSATYLSWLINDLLDQSQIEQGKIRVEAAPFNPQELIKQLNIALKPITDAKGLDFTTTIDPDLPDTINGDQKRLYQILTNLTNNALKFTPTGSVAVSIRRVGADRWAIQVADTGPGISPEAQAQVFAPFWQVDSSLTGKQKGYGLGLSIVKQLVDQMKGRITIDSVEGRGSTFTITLPLESVALPTQPAD